MFPTSVCTRLLNTCRINTVLTKDIGKVLTYTPCLLLRKDNSTSSVAKKNFSQRKPLSFDYSGDLVTNPTIPNAEIVYKYKDVECLEKESSDVKKLCSVEYASGEEIREHRLEEMNDRIKLLFGKDSLREQTIAKLTVEIRTMLPHCLHFRKDKRSKSLVIEKIQKRKKYLKFLRRDDYERFEWLLDELKIQYVPPPAYYKFVSKRCKRKNAVKEAAYALRESKISALKEKLESEKEAFLKYKEEVLEEIEKDADTYQIDKEDLKKVLVREREKSSKYVVWDKNQFPPN